MHILYLSQYFPPEAGATQTRAHEMARNWVRLGHTVTVIGEVPNHPSGIIPPEYRHKLYERAVLDGIDVIRVWVMASPNKNFRSRMLFYLSYMLSATLAGLLLARGKALTPAPLPSMGEGIALTPAPLPSMGEGIALTPAPLPSMGEGIASMIYASSPPLFVGAAALALSVLRRIPLVFEVRDLWPESAVALGELSNPRAIALATRLEEACYRRARQIVVVTEGIRDRLLGRGIPPEKLILAPNGANVSMFSYQSDERARVRRELGLGDKFVALYAGIHGIAQGLETIIAAADRLRADPAIHFLLIGDGPKKAEIASLAASLSLPNLTLLPEQPREAMPAYLSAADAALIPLRKLELFKGALPSKMFDAWACERPVLLSVDGEARRVLEEAGGGLFIPPEDSAALAASLLHLRTDPAGREAMGRRGRVYTEQNYSRQAIAEQLARRIMS